MKKSGIHTFLDLLFLRLLYLIANYLDTYNTRKRYIALKTVIEKVKDNEEYVSYFINPTSKKRLYACHRCMLSPPWLIDQEFYHDVEAMRPM